MKTKKWLYIIIAVVVALSAFSLAGCSNSTSNALMETTWKSVDFGTEMKFASDGTATQGSKSFTYTVKDKAVTLTSVSDESNTITYLLNIDKQPYTLTKDGANPWDGWFVPEANFTDGQAQFKGNIISTLMSYKDWRLSGGGIVAVFMFGTDNTQESIDAECADLDAVHSNGWFLTTGNTWGMTWQLGAETPSQIKSTILQDGQSRSMTLQVGTYTSKAGDNPAPCLINISNNQCYLPEDPVSL